PRRGKEPFCAGGADLGAAVSDRRKSQVAVQIVLRVVELTQADERLDGVDPRIDQRAEGTGLQLPLREAPEVARGRVQVAGDELGMSERAQVGQRMDLIRDRFRQLETAPRRGPRLIEEA